MIKAKPHDLCIIVDLLSKSFEDNQSVNYIISGGRKKPERLRLLIEYSVEICMMFGEVWLSEEKNACALILYPHQKKMTYRSTWLDCKLIFQVIGFRRIDKVIKREALIKQKHYKENMAYLWFIGVNPLYQRNGIGSKLLKEVIARATQKGLPIYLETSTTKNIPWYANFDFHVYDELALSYMLYFLKREISK